MSAPPPIDTRGQQDGFLSQPMDSPTPVCTGMSEEMQRVVNMAHFIFSDDEHFLSFALHHLSLHLHQHPDKLDRFLIELHSAYVALNRK